MHLWAQVLLTLCVIVITLVAVPALLALRRAAERADQVFGLLEQELRPTITEVRALAADLRALSRQAQGELDRVGALTEQARELSRGITRVVSGVAGLTRAGQLVGLAAAVKTGLNVFLHRLRRQEGDHHGE